MATPSARRSVRLAVWLLSLLAVAAAGAWAYRLMARAGERRDAIALAASGSPADALPALLRCLERDPSDPALLQAVVEAQIRAGVPVPDVEPFTTRWCAASPDDPAAFRSHLDVMRRLRRYDEALAAAERVLALAPNDDDARATAASLYLTLGRYDDAVREFTRLLSTSRGPQAGLLTGLARAECERGNRPEGVRLLDRALAEAPDFTPALVLRGTAHYQSGEYDQAVVVLRRARPASPAEAQMVFYHLGLALDRLGKADEAKKAFADLARAQEAVRFADDARQRPGDMALQLRAGQALLAAGYPAEAAQVLDAAAARNGPDRTLLTTLAECQERLGRPDLARETRARAARLP